MAAEDIISAFLKRIQLDRFLPEVFNVVRHKRADSAADDNIAVVAHTQVIDGDCEIIEVVVKDSAVAGIPRRQFLKKFHQIAAGEIREYLGRTISIQAAIASAIAAFPVGDDAHMSEFGRVGMGTGEDLAIIHESAAYAAA